MNYLFLLITGLAICQFQAAAQADTTEYKSEWVLHPFNFGVKMNPDKIIPLNDSLSSSGYRPLTQTFNNWGVELYHKSHLMLSCQLNIGSITDTLLKRKGTYNFIIKERFIGNSISIGYNFFPLTKIYCITLTPKIGCYYSRHKITTTNYQGDPSLLRSFYGNMPLEEKPVRLWESGIQASIKCSFSPFRKAGIANLVGFGLETGIQRNLNFMNNRSYDNGAATVIMMPPENRDTYYVTLNFEFARGLIYKN